MFLCNYIKLILVWIALDKSRPRLLSLPQERFLGSRVEPDNLDQIIVGACTQNWEAGEWSFWSKRKDSPIACIPPPNNMYILVSNSKDPQFWGEEVESSVVLSHFGLGLFGFQLLFFF